MRNRSFSMLFTLDIHAFHNIANSCRKIVTLTPHCELPVPETNESHHLVFIMHYGSCCSYYRDTILTVDFHYKMNYTILP